MARKTSPLLPSTHERLRRLGERLRLARRRRRLSAKQVAERAGMTPMTLRSLERGGDGVTIGAYAAVMQVLGVDKDLELLAAADPMGRALQDARLSGGRQTASHFPAAESALTRDASAEAEDAEHGEEHGPISAYELAALIDVPSAPRARKTKSR